MGEPRAERIPVASWSPYAYLSNLIGISFQPLIAALLG